MHFHDIALALVAFGSEILGTLSGFGSSTFFVPTALLLESFKFVLALTAILHCFGNLFRVLIFREKFEKKIFFLLVIPSIAFTGIGALLTAHFSGTWLVRVLGAVLIFFSIITLFKKIKIQSKSGAVVLSAISGFSTGFVGTGGAIRGVALAALQLPKNSFVFVSSAIDIGGDFLRAFIYIRNGFMDWNQWFYIPFLLVAAFAGAHVGKLLLGKINQTQFEKIVAIFILVSGIMMMFQG
jgi:uncharacterized membrane protein YfcA